MRHFLVCLLLTGLLMTRRAEYGLPGLWLWHLSNFWTHQRATRGQTLASDDDDAYEGIVYKHALNRNRGGFWIFMSWVTTGSFNGWQRDVGRHLAGFHWGVLSSYLVQRSIFFFFFPLGACGEQPKYRRRRWVSGVGRFWVNISLHGNTCVPTFLFFYFSRRFSKKVEARRPWPQVAWVCKKRSMWLRSGIKDRFFFFSEQGPRRGKFEWGDAGFARWLPQLFTGRPFKGKVNFSKMSQHNDAQNIFVAYFVNFTVYHVIMTPPQNFF